MGEKTNDQKSQSRPPISEGFLSGVEKAGRNPKLWNCPTVCKWAMENTNIKNVARDYAFLKCSANPPIIKPIRKCLLGVMVIVEKVLLSHCDQGPYYDLQFNCYFKKNFTLFIIQI